MAKIKLPFELQRPDANTPVANASEIDATINNVTKKLDALLTELNTALGNKVNTIILPEVGAKYVLTSTGWVAADVLKLIETQTWTDDKVLLIGDTDDENTISIVRARDEIRLVPESGKVVIEPNHGAAKLEMYKADGSTLEVLAAITQIQTDLSGKGTYSKPSNGIPSTDLESGVQTSLGKANSAVQKPSSTTDGKQYVMKNGEWEEITVPDGKDARVGELNDLQTSSKTSVVSAINEVLEVANGVADHETVTIVVSSSVTGVSVANRVINVYINGATTNPKQVTTDVNGRAVIQIDVPNTYRLVFPSIEGCNDIPDIIKTAATAQRLIEVNYGTKTSTDEKLDVVLAQYTGNVTLGYLVNKTVHVYINNVDNEIVSDSNGVASIDVPINSSVRVVCPTIEGYYAWCNEYEFTYTASKSYRQIRVKYTEYETGVFIVCKNGSQYTFNEFKEQNIPISTARLIKIASQKNSAENSVFGVSIDQLRGRTFASKQWNSQNQDFTSVPKSVTRITGYQDCLTLMNESEETGKDLPAIQYALSLSFELDNVTLPGFLGAAAQWATLWSNVSIVDEIIQYTRPINESGKFTNQITGSESTAYTFGTYTTNKWCSTQYNADRAYYFSTALTNNIKNFSAAVVPFFAF